MPTVPKCMALGVVPDTPYSDGRIDLLAGETLLLHTDGATDARDRAGELFGFDRLTRAVEQVCGKSAQEIVAGISAVVDAFADGAPPQDDLTLLAMTYLKN